MRVTKGGTIVAGMGIVAIGVTAVLFSTDGPPAQTQEDLERQAAEISAHRQAQRVAAPERVAAGGED